MQCHQIGRAFRSIVQTSERGRSRHKATSDGRFCAGARARAVKNPRASVRDFRFLLRMRRGASGRRRAADSRLHSCVTAAYNQSAVSPLSRYLAAPLRYFRLFIAVIIFHRATRQLRTSIAINRAPGLRACSVRTGAETLICPIHNTRM